MATATGRTVGTNLFQGKVLAVAEGTPAECVFVQAHRGDRPQALLGTGSNLWSADVEVTVRGPPKDREAARQLARTALQAAQQATVAGLTGYVLALLVDGEPEYLYPDVNGCHLYAFSLTVQWVA